PGGAGRPGAPPRGAAGPIRYGSGRARGRVGSDGPRAAAGPAGRAGPRGNRPAAAAGAAPGRPGAEGETAAGPPAGGGRAQRGVRRLRALGRAQAGPRGERRPGAAGQRAAREAERAVRVRAVAFARWAARLGLTLPEAAAQLGLSPRTLERW